MDCVVLGWPSDGPTLRLDHQRFAYAGKFVMSSTGKAVALTPGAPHDLPSAREGYAKGVLAAVAFNEDRTDSDALWLRYVTVRMDRRGEGIGTRLVGFTTARADERGYTTVRIAVNNPYSYEALSKAGFGFTGRETGLAELVMEHPHDRERYVEGFDCFLDRNLTGSERRFVREKRERGPPSVVDTPE